MIQVGTEYIQSVSMQDKVYIQGIFLCNTEIQTERRKEIPGADVQNRFCAKGLCDSVFGSKYSRLSTVYLLS